MVYRRRTNFRRRGTRRSLPVRHRFGRNRFARASRYRRTQRRVNWFGKHYNFKERFQVNQTLTLSPGGTAVQGFDMQPIAFPAWAYRKPLADQYRIYKWKIVIAPQVMTPNSAGIDTSGTNVNNVGLCQHALVPDYSDSSIPGSWAGMIDNPRCIRTSVFHPLKMIITPRVLKAAYETGTTTGNAWMPGFGWIDSQDDHTPHYGFKWMADATNAHFDNPINFRVTHTVYYGMKNTQATL